MGLFSKDALLEIAKGNVPGHTVIEKFGRNDAVPNGSWADIQTIGGSVFWHTTADTLNAVSTSANDTAAGSGARVITIQGLDANFDVQEEDLALSGVTPVTSANSYIRVHRVFVKDTGTYGGLLTGGNAGNISFTKTTGGNAIGEILIDNSAPIGQTQLARYTIPNAKTAYLFAVDVNVEVNKPARVVMWQRQGADVVAAPFTSKRMVLEFDGLQQPDDLQMRVPLMFPGKTDLWFSAEGGGAATQVNVRFLLILVDD